MRQTVPRTAAVAIVAFILCCSAPSPKQVMAQGGCNDTRATIYSTVMWCGYCGVGVVNIEDCIPSLRRNCALVGTWSANCRSGTIRCRVTIGDFATTHACT